MKGLIITDFERTRKLGIPLSDYKERKAKTIQLDGVCAVEIAFYKGAHVNVYVKDITLETFSRINTNFTGVPHQIKEIGKIRK